MPLGDLCEGCATAAGGRLYGAPTLAGLQHGGDAGIARNVLDATLVPALGLRLGLSLSLLSDPPHLAGPAGRQNHCAWSKARKLGCQCPKTSLSET
jgi:hypothetical protein